MAGLAGAASAPGAEPPLPVPWVVMTPNAIATVDQPIRVTVGGEAAQTIYLLVLRDCNGDWRQPELPRKGCTAVAAKTIQLQTNETRRVFALDVAELLRSGLETGQPYWLRVSAVAEGTRAYRQAMFGILLPKDRCTLWKTLLGTVGLAERCAAGVGPALSLSLGSLGGGEGWPRGVLEVVRWRLEGGKAVAERVAGTRGATGVAWADDHTLLVTLRGPAESGLWRIDPMRGRRERLVAGTPGTRLMAPRALGDGRVAYVRGLDQRAAGGAVAYLEVWAPGAGKPAVPPIPLRAPVQQLLAGTGSGSEQAVLGERREDGRSTLVWIGLATGTETELGSDEVLRHAVLHADTGPRTAVTFQDPRDKAGWELVLVDEAGALAEEVAVGAGDALWPAWRPGALELAFVATAAPAAGGK